MASNCGGGHGEQLRRQRRARPNSTKLAAATTSRRNWTGGAVTTANFAGVLELCNDGGSGRRRGRRPAAWLKWTRARSLRSPAPACVGHAGSCVPCWKRREDSGRPPTTKLLRGSCLPAHCSRLTERVPLYFSHDLVQKLEQLQEQKLFIHLWPTDFLKGPTSKAQ
jgi:hypothetical protein